MGTGEKVRCIGDYRQRTREHPAHDLGNHKEYAQPDGYEEAALIAINSRRVMLGRVQVRAALVAHQVCLTAFI